MLLGRNAEFFRQKEKNVGFIKSNNGGDGGFHERNASTSEMALPGMRPVRPTVEVGLITGQGQDFPDDDIPTGYAFRVDTGS